MKIEISRCLDLRYKSKGSLYPVCIRIYHNRRYDYIKTGIHLSKEEYENLHSSKIKSALKERLKTVVDVETLVTTYLDDNSPFDIDRIRACVFNSNKDKFNIPAKTIKHSDNVFDWFENKIQLCKKNKQFGSGESYQSTKSVYQDYLKVSVIGFSFFTVEHLKEMETSMMEKRGISISTVGKHSRNLRAIFKIALSENFIINKDYPFGRYKYVIPEVTKAKKSLSRKMLGDLIKYKPVNYYEKRAISYFIFSYYGNGMNLKDMAYLKFRDCKNDVLYYCRKKTKNTTSRQRIIKVIVNDEMKTIIKEFGNQFNNHDDYIFPIIKAEMDEELIYTKVKTRSNTINRTLKRICKKLSFDKVITLGMARHTFANALKQEGVSINFIQESLGHGSATTTEHYMSSFEDAISKEHIGKLKKYYE